MPLSVSDFLIKIDANRATDLELKLDNKYSVVSWDESYSFSRVDSRPGEAPGSIAYQGFQQSRTVNLGIIIETFNPDEFATAKDELEDYLIGSATAGGGFRLNHFTLYRYANGGGGGSRFLQDCYCRSFRNTLNEGQLHKAGNPFSPISITIIATDPDWQTGGAASSGVTHTGSVLIQVPTGTVGLSIRNITTGKYVFQVDSLGDVLSAKDLTNQDDNIPAP